MVMYRPRVLDAVLADRLTSAGAVLIQGPESRPVVPHPG